MKLETDRLLLRSLQPQDVEQMVSLVTDPGVTRFLGGPRDAEQVRTILQNEPVEQPGRLGQWPVVLKITGEFVGGCGLISKEIEGVTEVERGAGGHRIIAAGDLTIYHGCGERGSTCWAGRYESVFARMAAIRPSFLGPQFPNGRRAESCTTSTLQRRPTRPPATRSATCAGWRPGAER